MTVKALKMNTMVEGKFEIDELTRGVIESFEHIAKNHLPTGLIPNWRVYDYQLDELLMACDLVQVAVSKIADLSVLAFYLCPKCLCFFAVGGYELVID